MKDPFVTVIRNISALCAVGCIIMISIVMGFLGSMSNSSLLTVLLISIISLPFGLTILIHLKNRYLLTWNNLLVLFLLILLIGHRAMIPRITTFTDELSPFLLAETIITVAIFLLSAILFISSVNFGNMSFAEKLLIVFSLYSAISTIWAPNHQYAFFWNMRLLSASFLLSTALRNVRNHELILNAVIIGSLFYLPWMWLGFFAGESNLGPYRVVAGWIHPVTMSITMYSIAAYFWFKVIVQKVKFIYLLLLFVCLATGVLSGGKTGAISFVIVIAVLTLLCKPKMIFSIKIWLIILVITILVYFSLRINIGLLPHLFYYIQLGGAPTLIGRFDLWHNAIKSWLESPWTVFFGHGYTSARIIGIPFTYREPTTHAHNSFINLLFELGLLGLVMWIAFLWASLRGVVRLYINRPQNGLPALGLFSVLLLSSCFDNVFGGLIYAPFYLLVTTGVTSCRIAYAHTFHPQLLPTTQRRGRYLRG